MALITDCFVQDRRGFNSTPAASSARRQPPKRFFAEL
jgi:hypothetical protein